MKKHTLASFRLFSSSPPRSPSPSRTSRLRSPKGCRPSNSPFRRSSRRRGQGRGRARSRPFSKPTSSTPAIFELLPKTDYSYIRPLTDHKNPNFKEWESIARHRLICRPSQRGPGRRPDLRMVSVRRQITAVDRSQTLSVHRIQCPAPRPSRGRRYHETATARSRSSPPKSPSSRTGIKTKSSTSWITTGRISPA